MTPEEVILRKNLVSSVRPDGRGISSAEWASFSAAVKDRAFFSANVESVRFLDTARTRIAELLAAAKNPDSDTFVSRAQVVSDIMRSARDAGIARGTNLISDPGSAARANVIIDTNAGLAAGYAKAELSNSYGARLAFPAQELVRIEERQVPRDWRSTWIKHGGKLLSGRMVALKDDPIWVAISRFGVPYPPFDFNSGMGLEDVSFDETVSLGLIKDDYQPPQTSPLDNFNKSLEAEMEFKNDATWRNLKATFGDQIRQHNGKIVWRHDLFKEAFENSPFTIQLGKPSKDLLAKLPSSVPANSFAGKPLIVNEDWLDNKREHGIDHRDHFVPRESDDRNIPLTLADVELLPEIWRRPEKVENGSSRKHPFRLLLSMKATDGGIYRAVVDYEDKDKVKLVTFYKNKPK